MGDELWVASYFHEPPSCEEEEFTIHTALDLPFLRRFLEKYPEQATDELHRVASGEIAPEAGKIVEILELIDRTINDANSGHPWFRYPATDPRLDAQKLPMPLWLYDEDNEGDVKAGTFAETVNDLGLIPYPFRNEQGEQMIITHWAIRDKDGQVPNPPPRL